MNTFSYNDWYIRAVLAWTAYDDTLKQIEEITGDEDRNYLPELTMEAKEWKEAAEYAEKMMADWRNWRNARAIRQAVSLLKL